MRRFVFAIMVSAFAAGSAVAQGETGRWTARLGEVAGEIEIRYTARGDELDWSISRTLDAAVLGIDLAVAEETPVRFVIKAEAGRRIAFRTHDVTPPTSPNGAPRA